jgi:hypothetical protein
MNKNAQVVDNSAIKKSSESGNKRLTPINSSLSSDQFRHLWKTSDN